MIHSDIFRFEDRNFHKLTCIYCGYEEKVSFFSKTEFTQIHTCQRREISRKSQHKIIEDKNCFHLITTNKDQL